MAQRVPKDFKEITDEKTSLEGILAELIDSADFSRWKVYIQAPEGTPFSGGIFLTHLTFPPPPELVFISEMFHPNVYPDGKVCISILHPPGKDIYSDERPEERWMPSHTPVSIFNCFLTLLSEPNIFSPANIDASVMWRDNKAKFGKKAKELVDLSKSNLPRGVLERIPHPDTDPRHRAQRIADKIVSLDQNDSHYSKTKQQLQKETLSKLNDKNLATSLYQELCPSEFDFDHGGGGDDELVQAWDDDDDGGCDGFAEDDDSLAPELRNSAKPVKKVEEAVKKVVEPVKIVEEPKAAPVEPKKAEKSELEARKDEKPVTEKTKKSSSSHKSSSDKHKSSSGSSHKHSDGHKEKSHHSSTHKSSADGTDKKHVHKEKK